MKRRVLFVARDRITLPLDGALARKWSALCERLDVRILATSGDGSRGDSIFTLLPALPGPAHYAALPLAVARELRRFDPEVVIAQSPYETGAALAARGIARRSPKVVCELHGDWRTMTRLYGSPRRRLLSAPADALAAAAVRRADAVRTISGYTTRLAREQGREPAATFLTYSDLEVFAAVPPVPLPERPRAIFVGVLERYKNIDGLVAAWRRVATELPDTSLHIVGRGTERAPVERLVAELPGRVEWDERLEAAEVARALDASTVLLLPSTAEGLGRVVVEAFLRGRPVVGARVGGIPDLVVDGVNGLLVDPADHDAIAAAAVRVLGDPQLAAALAAQALPSTAGWLAGPEEFADNVARLVESALR